MVDVKTAFELFDKTGAGNIATKDVPGVLRACGRIILESEMQEILTGVGKSTIDLAGLTALCAKGTDIKDSEADIQESFKVFDRDDLGVVASAEIRQSLMNMGEKVPEDEVDDMLNQADVDGSGNIKYEDFIKKLMAM